MEKVRFWPWTPVAAAELVIAEGVAVAADHVDRAAGKAPAFQRAFVEVAVERDDAAGGSRCGDPGDKRSGERN
jgi:hypothetical protein